MSLAGLANNYVLRTSEKTDPTAHTTLAAKGTVEEVQGLPNVPQGYANQLVRWIPTEALSLYAALGALVGSALSTAQSLVLFAISGLLGVAYVWAAAVFKKATEAKVPDSTSKWSLFWPNAPVFEMTMAAVAFTLWISALPESWPTHLSWWKQQYGAGGVIVAAFVVPLIAKISGKTPPASEISFP